MTAYENLIRESDRLAAEGISAVPGVREIKFREAQDLRELADGMTVEEAEQEVEA